MANLKEKQIVIRDGINKMTNENLFFIFKSIDNYNFEKNIVKHYECAILGICY